MSPDLSTAPDVATLSPVEHQRGRLFPWVKPYYRDPLVIQEAEGVRVRDVEGRSYLDFFAGILTTSVGHCHPEVVARVQTQVARLGHTSTLYVTEGQLEVADTLTRLAPGRLSRVAFTNSGTEAVETAIQAACCYTGRSEIIALRHSYSGRSILATNLTGHAPWRPMASSVAGIKHARAPYVFRSPLGPTASDEEHTRFFLDDLVEVIETTTSGRPAALLVETIMGVGGFIVPPQGYLEGAAEIIRSYGGVLISDEVQAGFGRTGTHWFGCQHFGVEPDLMVMAKGIANGFPVAATIATDEVADAWAGLSVSTYGGNPVSMAATAATLEVMEREDVPERSRVRGEQLRAGLDELGRCYPWIGEVRGMGLMQAMELVKDPHSRAPDAARARALMEAAREEGLLIGAGGLNGNVIRIGPSMLITEAETAEGLERLARACARAAADGADA
ncbi:MAG: aspartate aminotransferase family protein [Gemmatimonadales bacterium]|nr:MAG: aspartate aminotransferase family protein [Gemmatimonadales bacterium]